MRSRSELAPLAALATLLSAGCLSAPEGRARTWPPPLTSVDIAAAASGDVDGDGLDDLVAVVSGKESDGGGVYLLRGGVDIQPQNQAGLVTGFSNMALVGDVDGPAALTVFDVDAATPNKDVAVFLEGTTRRFLVLSGGKLDQRFSREGSAIPSSGPVDFAHAPPPWVKTAPFGPGGDFMFFTSGNDIRNFSVHSLRDGKDGDLRILPSDPNSPWQNPLGIGALDATGRTVAVWTEEMVTRGSVEGGPIKWAQARKGERWFATQPLDLNDDGVNELVGLQSVSPATVCALDAVKAEPLGCAAADVDLPSPPEDSVRTDLDGDGRAGMAMLAGSTVSVLEDFALPAGKLQVSLAKKSNARFAGAQLVTGQYEPGHNALLVIGHGGDVDCLSLKGSGELGRCIGP